MMELIGIIAFLLTPPLLFLMFVAWVKVQEGNRIDKLIELGYLQ